MSFDPLPTVSEGRYYGFSNADLATVKAQYVAAVKALDVAASANAGQTVSMMAMNGKSVTYDTTASARRALDEWRRELQLAEDQLAGEPARFSDRAVCRF